MIDSLGLAIVGYGLGLALLLIAVAVWGRPRPPVLTTGLVVLQFGSILAALLDGLALLRGRHDAAVATNVGYLLTVLAVLPLTALAVRGETGRWANIGFAVGCVLLAVLSVRLRQTLGPTRG